MRRNPVLYKFLVVGVIVLFIGVGLKPAFAIVTNTNIKSPKETINVNISYIKPSGVENTDKTISIKTLNHILNLMDNEEFETLSNLLINLNLAPQSMDIDQLEELISGELTRKEYANIFSKNDNNLYGDSTVLRNIFCKVEGHAVDHFFDTPFTHAVEWGVHLATLPIILFLFFIDILLVLYLPGYSTFPYYNTPLQNLILSIVDFGDTLKSLLNPYKKPERFVPVALPRLGDWFPVHQNPNLSTKGLLGEWVMEEYQGIDLMMVGFSGIWISYNDGYQYQACNFSGTSLYVKADGINYEP